MMRHPTTWPATASGADWTDVDLSGWTIARDTKGVIDSVSARAVAINDVEANTTLGDLAVLQGPAISVQPGDLLEAELEMDASEVALADGLQLMVGFSSAPATPTVELAAGVIRAKTPPSQFRAIESGTVQYGTTGADNNLSRAHVLIAVGSDGALAGGPEHFATSSGATTYRRNGAADAAPPAALPATVYPVVLAGKGSATGDAKVRSFTCSTLRYRVIHA